MAAEFPPIVARNYFELVDALARIKNLLGLQTKRSKKWPDYAPGIATNF
jgi:hypothetical protein